MPDQEPKKQEQDNQRKFAGQAAAFLDRETDQPGNHPTNAGCQKQKVYVIG